MVIRSRKARPVCEGCGEPCVVERLSDCVVLVDLPAVRTACSGCGGGNGAGRVRTRGREIRSFIEQDPKIGPERALLTSKAAQCVNVQVGGRGRPVDEVASALD